MTRKIFIFGFAAGIVGLALACDSSSESSSSGGNGNGTSSGTSGSQGSSGSQGNGSGFKNCATQGTSCSEAELKPYSDCLADKCEAGWKKCYGDGFMSGSFSGPCGTYMECVQKCDCADTNCVIACKPDEACQTCATEIVGCGDSCTEPECAKTTPDAGSKNATCADLTACCDSMAAGEQKDGCQSAKDEANNDDSKCATYYNAFKAGGLCN